MTLEKLEGLQSPPGMPTLEANLQSAWLEVVMEAKKCWVLWYGKNGSFVGNTHVCICICVEVFCLPSCGCYVEFRNVLFLITK